MVFILHTMQNGKQGLVLTVVALVGLIIGGAGGYYVGYDNGLEGATAQQEAAVEQNPFADVETNPLENVEANPLENVKTNPFE